MNMKIFSGAAGVEIDKVLSANGVFSTDPETELIERESDAEFLALKLKDAFAPGPKMRNHIPKVFQITYAGLLAMAHDEQEKDDPEIIGQHCHCPNGQCLCIRNPNRLRQFDSFGRRRRL